MPYRYYLNAEFNDVFFDLQLLDEIKIGESFSAVRNFELVEDLFIN